MKLYRLNQGEFRSWRDRQARAELERVIFGQHGNTQVRAPSGRILGTVRAPDKSARIPIEKSVARGAHHAVSPRECLCREWQKPAGKADQHHPICAHKQHWEAQQARSPDEPRERVVVSSRDVAEPQGPAALALEPGANVAPTEPAPTPAVAPPTLSPRAPSDCLCQEWSGAVSGKHHPLCAFRKTWEQLQGEAAPQLLELETGSVIREATEEEALASKQKAVEDGVGAIELSDGKLYYVKEA